MKENEAKRLYRLLMDKDIQTWVVGGWGIDALYGQQTRSHKDLDLIMQVDDIDNACQTLNKAGYSIKTLFSENRSDRDYFGITIDTAFILMNSQEEGVDVHAIRFDSSGNGIPAWDESDEFIFSRADLKGCGVIGGMQVRCISVQSQIVCHSGYTLPEYQIQDMEILQKLLRTIEDDQR